MNIPITVGVVGVVFAPILTLIGLSASVLAKYRIKIENEDEGTIVDLGEFSEEKLNIIKDMVSSATKDVKQAVDKRNKKTEDKNAKTAQQFASGEVCSLLNHGVSDGSQYWYQNIDNDGEKDQAPVADSSHGTVYTGYQECVKSYSNEKLPESPTAHDTIYTAQGNVITGICKKDSAHSVRMTVSGKGVVYDKTAHAVDIGIELSEEWGKIEVPYEIFYTREGTRTEDLTSPGTIKATVSVGTAKVEVVYTIKEAPTEKPVVTPTAKPTGKPAATPTAKPTKTSDSQATKKPAEREKAVPKKVGAILKVKGNKYRVTKSKAKGSTVEFTGYTNKKKKKVTIPESITVQGVEYDVTSIGEKAFSNCKKLTLLEIKTKKLTKKTVAKKTFKSIRKKTVIKVPKSKYKAYKKVLRARTEQESQDQKINLGWFRLRQMFMKNT